MVVNAPMATNEITDCEYKRQEMEFRQVLLSRFLQAMREDLAEWISSLTFNVSITEGNFIDSLENGVILCQQARLIQRFAEEYAVVNSGPKLSVPKREVSYTEKAAYKGSFVARDNVANFIYWCRELGIPDVVLFESEDLVLHKNEKSVILTLLDVARKAFKFGVQPPEIVRFEKEIDEEIEQDKEDERMGKRPPIPIDLEEDNNLDTMVRNIVNKCTCYDRFPIKKLAEGKYQFGKSNTLIFVRVMRKHVMVRVGGGWDTFEHYIIKHDPCRTKVAGNIDNNGQTQNTATPTQHQHHTTQSISPRRKKSAHEKRDTSSRLTESTISTASSDTWSMCSGSSEGSGSADGCYNEKSRPRQLCRKTSAMSTSSTETSSDPAIQFTKSIEEIDRRLKSMENHKPTLDMNIKDPSVYEHRADSWLRSHLNTLKQRRLSEAENMRPMDEFIMKRGYTADNIERPKSKKQEQNTTPKLERKGSRANRVAQIRTRSKSTISNSLDQGLNKDPILHRSSYSSSSSCQTYNSNTRYAEEDQSNLETLSSTSSQSLLSVVSEPSHRRSCSNISTQTETEHGRSSTSSMPAALRKKAAENLLTSPSKIPRPVFTRSKTSDNIISTSSKLKRRNSTNSGTSGSRRTATMPRMLREKSGLSNRPNMRREKSDITGQHSKYKMVSSPGPVRRKDIGRKEKPVRIRNGPVLTTTV